jgi:hypothetical protein
MRRSPWAGAAIAFVLAGAIGGCAELGIVASPPHFDQKTLDGLNTVRTDTDTLFAQLEKPAPNCLFSNNTAGFDKLATDISAVKTQAGTISNNTHTVNGITDLGDSADHFRKAASSGTTTCLPANIAKNQQTQMDTAIQKLVDYEQAKPH